MVMVMVIVMVMVMLGRPVSNQCTAIALVLQVLGFDKAQDSNANAEEYFWWNREASGCRRHNA
jgi:hypothetical protein